MKTFLKMNFTPNFTILNSSGIEIRILIRGDPISQLRGYDVVCIKFYIPTSIFNFVSAKAQSWIHPTYYRVAHVYRYSVIWQQV